MKKQISAVEWLVNVVQSCIAPDYIPTEIIEKAKAMEREQIMDAHLDGQTTWDVTSKTAEKYYNETFKSE